METARSVTALLHAWKKGDSQARDELMERVYPELRRIAGAHFKRERSDHSLQPTAVVHEAYIRLVGQVRVEWQDRRHFYAVASQMMRRVLVDHARARQRQKRRAERVSLHEHDAVTRSIDVDVVALDRALDKLESGGFELESQVIQLKFLGGLSVDEVAEHLSVSPRTVGRAWTYARARLFHELGPRR